MAETINFPVFCQRNGNRYRIWHKFYVFMECGCNITAMSFLKQPTSILPWRIFYRENLNLLLTNFTALSSYPPKDYCVGWKKMHIQTAVN